LKLSEPGRLLSARNKGHRDAVCGLPI
jgi:hypothetical protein